MFKPSKFINALFTFFFICFFGLMGYLAVEMNKAEKANNSSTMEFVTFEYEVSRVDPYGLYGNSTSDNTGIYIRHDKLQPNQEINEGDVIKVYFNRDDLQEGIEHVEVLDNE